VRLAAAQRALEAAVRRAAERRLPRLRAAAGRLDALSPLAVLGRGYAIAQLAASGAILRRASQAEPGDALRILLAEGELEAAVTARRGPAPGSSEER
jgi:exodeoxyribonuclease VII large subunit